MSQFVHRKKKFQKIGVQFQLVLIFFTLGNQSLFITVEVGEFPEGEVGEFSENSWPL